MPAVMSSKRLMKVLLLGDSCEDEYIYGRCTRISPEAPVPVLDYAKIKTTSGMAGNVCLNLQSFVKIKFSSIGSVIEKSPEVPM